MSSHSRADEQIGHVPLPISLSGITFTREREGSAEDMELGGYEEGEGEGL